MSTLSFCPPNDLARGACRTLGVCWGHECVGFADCPCMRCRHLRLSHTEAHPNHPHVQDESYCGVCKTVERERHYASPSAALLRSVTRSPACRVES